MADLNPLEPGDVSYPQYSVTTTQQISDALQITKGVVYTKDAAGRLIIVAATLAKGIFQAKATPTAPAVVANLDAVQVLSPRSRILMNDTVGSLVVGQDVTQLVRELICELRPVCALHVELEDVFARRPVLEQYDRAAAAVPEAARRGARILPGGGGARRSRHPPRRPLGHGRLRRPLARSF